MSKKEFRYIAQQFDVGDGNTIAGYAVRFNSPSQIIYPGFREVISPKVNIQHAPDVRALVEHDPMRLLGRTSSGTLALTQDDTGLAFRCDIPDTSYGRDLKVMMQRGDIKACSFGMSVNKDTWSRDTDGEKLRTVTDLSLFEVTVTANPAYPETSAQLRSLFPDGEIEVPELRDLSDDLCGCSCPECLAGDCADCSNPDCALDECLSCPMRALRSLHTERNRLLISLAVRGVR